MDRGEFPKRFYAPELGHRSLSSSEGLMRVFGPIVEPTAGHLAGLVSDLLHSCPVGTKAVRHNNFRTSVSLHHSTQKPQCSLAISLLCDKRFKDFSFVINCPPEVLSFAVDPHENLVQMPSPLWRAPHRSRPLPSNLRCKHWS